MTKVCSKCKEEKCLDQFNQSKLGLDGKKSYCKNCQSFYFKQWRKKNIEHCLQAWKKWKNKNRSYEKNREQWDLLYKLKRRYNRRLRHAIKGQGWKKTTSSKDLLGCSYEQLKQHLEANFTEGMTWDNQGQWHIDHIIPLASAKTEEEIYKLCHYTNLQPLWAAENLAKGAKILPNDQNPQT